MKQKTVPRFAFYLEGKCFNQPHILGICSLWISLSINISGCLPSHVSPFVKPSISILQIRLEIEQTKPKEDPFSQ